MSPVMADFVAEVVDGEVRDYSSEAAASISQTQRNVCLVVRFRGEADMDRPGPDHLRRF